jgi:hypothetical protein
MHFTVGPLGIPDDTEEWGINSLILGQINYLQLFTDNPTSRPPASLIWRARQLHAAALRWLARTLDAPRAPPK